jgi:hypothetical protein
MVTYHATEHTSLCIDALIVQYAVLLGRESDRTQQPLPSSARHPDRRHYWPPSGKAISPSDALMEGVFSANAKSRHTKLTRYYRE